MRHKIHKNRTFIDWLGKLLHKEKCSCIFHFDETGECQRRFLLDNYNVVAGTYGEDVYICSYCYLKDKKEIDNWSQGRRDFVQKVQREDPGLWKVSTRHKGEIEASRFV